MMMYNVRLTHKEIGIEKIPRAVRALRGFVVARSINDYVFLQTCNRAELYYLDGVHQPPNGFVFESGTEAFRHLLRVACGLESFVVGETEVLNQIKKAFAHAKRDGHCSKEFSRYFMDAIRVGRKSKKLTKISAGKVSIVSLALEHACNLLGDLTGKKFLVIGAGEVGTKVAKSLKNMDVEKILISNRNYSRALKLARDIGGSAHHLPQLKNLIGEVDCVFCATNAPHPILTRDKVEAAKDGLVLVDLSVPRNVEKSIQELENVKLVSFEHFVEKASQNMNERVKEIKKVETIIDLELEHEKDNLRDLYLYAEQTRKEEVKKALRSLGSKNPEEVIEGLSKSLVKKLYHPLREHAAKVEIPPDIVRKRKIAKSENYGS